MAAKIIVRALSLLARVVLFDDRAILFRDEARAARLGHHHHQIARAPVCLAGLRKTGEHVQRLIDHSRRGLIACLIQWPADNFRLTSAACLPASTPFVVNTCKFMSAKTDPRTSKQFFLSGVTSRIFHSLGRTITGNSSYGPLASPLRTTRID